MIYNILTAHSKRWAMTILGVYYFTLIHKEILTI